MKWGRYYEAEKSFQLLFWVLQCVFRPYNKPLDCWLKYIMVRSGGFGGDPGWEIEHIPSDSGPGAYRVWADPDVSGIEQAEAVYCADDFRDALRTSLIAFGDAYPERADEMRELLIRYKL